MKRDNSVIEKRKELVDMIISLMEQDSFFFNRAEWSRAAFAPHNPFSNAIYRGGNRIRLMVTAYKHGYDDPRWATFKQVSDAGLSIKKGSKGVTCEKWCFYKEEKMLDASGNVITDKNGKPVKTVVELEHPICNMFTLFHASQIEGMPELELGEIKHGYQVRYQSLRMN